MICDTEYCVRSDNVLCSSTEKIRKLFIFIKNDKIDDLIEDLPQNQALLQQKLKSIKLIDMHRQYIVPGNIDINVSLHPGFEDVMWEDIDNLTRTAVSGGTTTIINNPLLMNSFNTIDSNYDMAKLDQIYSRQIKIMQENCKTDFGMIGLLTKSLVDKVKTMTQKHGFLGFRLYLSPPFQHDIEYCSNTRNLVDMFDKLNQNLKECVIFIHPSMMPGDKDLGATSPMRKLPLNKRINQDQNYSNLLVSDALKGEVKDDILKESEFKQNISQDEREFIKEYFTRSKDITSENIFKLLSQYEQLGYSENKQEYKEMQSSKGMNENPQNQNNSWFSVEDQDSDLDKVSKQNDEADAILGNNEDLEEQVFVRRFSVISYNQETPMAMKQTNELNILKAINQKTYDLIGIDNLNNLQKNQKQQHSSMKQIQNRLQNNDDENEEQNYGNHVVRQSERQIMNFESKKFDSHMGDDIEVIDQEDSEEEERNEIRAKSFSIQKLRNHNNDDSKSNSNISYQQHYSNKNSPTKAPFNFNIIMEEIKFHNESSQCEIQVGSQKSQGFQSQNLSSPKSIQQKKSAPSSLQKRRNKNLELKASNPIKRSTSPNDKNQQSQVQQSYKKQPSIQPIKNNDSQKLQLSPNQENQEKESDYVQTLSKSQTQFSNIYSNFLAFRPPLWEHYAITAVRNALNNFTGQKKLQNISIVLTNIGNSYSVAKIYKLKNIIPDIQVFCEVSYPYLFFDSDKITKGDTRFKNEPPINCKDNKKLLISILKAQNTIDCVSSYHFSVPKTYKYVNQYTLTQYQQPYDDICKEEQESGNFRLAFNGFYSIGVPFQTLWTILWINIKKKMLKESLKHLGQSHKQLDQLRSKLIEDSLKIVVETLCRKPAQILKIDGMKGEIKKGMDADFVVWNPFLVHNFSTGQTQRAKKFSSKLHIFDNTKLYGVINHTFIRGQEVFRRQQSEVVFQKKFTAKYIQRESINIYHQK